MKKLLLALPLIAGASWAGTTLYSGSQTQPAYNRLLEQLNNSEILTVKSVEYEAGFTSSTAVTEVRINDSKSEDVVYLQHKISHSPVSMVPENARFGAAKIVTTMITDKLEDEEAKAFFTSFDTGEPIIVHTDVAMDGATTSEITINAFEQRNAEAHIKTSGATINVVTNSSGAVSGEGIIKDVFFTDDGALEFKILDNKIKFDFERIDENYFNLNFDMSLDEVLVAERTASDKILFHLKDAFVELHQQLNNDKPYLRQSIGIKSLVSKLVPLKSFALTTELANFSSTQALANTHVFQNLQSEPDIKAWIKSEEFDSLLKATFIPDTSLSLDANAEFIYGNADADVKLWFTGNGTTDGYAGMTTTGDLAKAFAGTARIDADKSAVMMTPLGAMLDEPLAQIYLNITDDAISLDAKLEELYLTLNEQILPLEIIGGEILQMPLKEFKQMLY